MGRIYTCSSPQRGQHLRENERVNGIEYLEVLDRDTPAGIPPQRTLVVRAYRALPETLTASGVRIAGGVRTTSVAVEWAGRADRLPAAGPSDADRAFSSSLPEAARTLVVRTDRTGDFSPYRLRLVAPGAGDNPPEGFDPILSEIEFFFKVECPTEGDCADTPVCPPPALEEPRLDYQAKDYASFRRLMLDRLSQVAPRWRERNPADLGVAVVEAVAHVADQLSYYQDAVATEAYLGTARQRISVRRHARLLDYPMHDGRNARAWVVLEVAPEADGVLLPGPRIRAADGVPRPGTRLLGSVAGADTVVPESEFQRLADAGALVFETMHELVLRPGRNAILFHTWGDEGCCLPAGATRATLRNRSGALDDLAAGDFLLFEQVRDPETLQAADADPRLRHVVRVAALRHREDPLFARDGGTRATGPRLSVVDVSWDAADALPFALPVGEVLVQEDGTAPPVPRPLALARGNVVLADHGRTLLDEPIELSVPAGAAPWRARLQHSGVTQQSLQRTESAVDAPFDPAAPAASAVEETLRLDRSAVVLLEKAPGGERPLLWRPCRSLLASGPFAREFVVETDDAGTAHLRFGDGAHGLQPAPGARLRASYRVGNGSAGNAGAGAIAHVVAPESDAPGTKLEAKAVLRVRNPLPARGGQDPESIAQVRIRAPQAFRVQRRAVTEEDWTAAARQHPGVQRARAQRRWTGSWTTVFLAVDRKGGAPVDAAFEEELRAFLEPYRLAGADLEIAPPRFVPLDIAFTVCVRPGHYRGVVQRALLERFSNRVLAGGRRGWFHPDNFSFGEHVHLSPIVAAVLAVPGVERVELEEAPPGRSRFRRLGVTAPGGIAADRIAIGLHEIPRLDNDPNAPENGRIEFEMRGGL
ncbi:MAG: putative baseplate assembly protein [Planctomycetota bacterium]|nr:MAG: putative baseplate assembly protein [Planctomycetota bacterium]